MFTEVTFTSSDGTRFCKYMVVASNVYERNRLISTLIEELHDKWNGYPLFDIFELNRCYN